jgi:hypothetical protein
MKFYKARRVTLLYDYIKLDGFDTIIVRDFGSEKIYYEFDESSIEINQYLSVEEISKYMFEDMLLEGIYYKDYVNNN